MRGTDCRFRRIRPALARAVRAALLAFLVARGGHREVFAQSNLYSFSTTNGTRYTNVKIVRIDDDEILYLSTLTTGGGRIKFRDLPADVAEQFRALKQRGLSFAESVAPSRPHANVLGESVSSDQGTDGANGDAALLALENATSKLFCAFSREVLGDQSRFLIVVNHDGPRFLDLNNQDSLQFNADGRWIKCPPLAGSFREELKNGRPIETAAYESSLPDIRTIGGATALSIRISGLTGAEDFAVPATNILKKFAQFCETNAPGATAPQLAAEAQPRKARVYTMSDEEAKLNQSPYFRTMVNDQQGRVQQWMGHPLPVKLPSCRVNLVREFSIGGPAAYRLGFEVRETPPNQYALAPSNPVIFRIDGETISLPNPDARLNAAAGPEGESIRQWYSPAPEELIRKLARAKEAGVELPGTPPFEYQFSRVELDRFALFARVFMGINTASR